ncbi:hypothetical protein [Actinophytocola oryzae]|uniref:Serine/threonine protein kinase n=1 Tax=Actinophytocola oryzae TaxID=502181 RepID=A0A4R7W2V2_9PSEU|nr:hypothetical protein [Actinophytocola oryzae]TDV56475.1 serine/threonine protein kinase [Actinophytocola oryzae]
MNDLPQPPAIDAEAFRPLFRQVAALNGTASDATRLRAIRRICGTPDEWRRLLAAIPLDKLSFHLEVGLQRSDAIDRLAQWCGGFKANSSGHTRSQAETYGYLSVLLLTLVTMQEAGAPRSTPASTADGDDGNVGHDCGLCRRLVQDAAVRATLLGLYAPRPGSGGDEQAHAEWRRIRPETLEFHRHGTTSIILGGTPLASSGRQIRFALKCVLFPYSNIPIIARKTRNYANDHNSTDRDGRAVQHMVQVWASTDDWILMDMADGITLAEELARMKREKAAFELVGRAPRRGTTVGGNVRLDLIRRLGLPLLHALAQLHVQGKQHEDLSPTNIIVKRKASVGHGQDYEVTFIDFGRNYLYTSAVGSLEGAEGVYVAPEIRDSADDVPGADLYSLGRILITVGDVGENSDGTIPDRFYGQAPLIARVIEDLTDREPARRLLVFRMAADNPDVYRTVGEVLEQELDVTQEALVTDPELRGYAVPVDRQSLSSSVRSLLPLSREPKKQRRIYRFRRRQGVLSDPRRSMHARWLLVFSVLASVNLYVCCTVCVYWFLRDVGIDVLNPQSQAFLRLVGARPDTIPLVDDLRQSGYELGNLAENTPARLIGLSFALCGARYYQNIFSGLTTRVARSPAMAGAGSRVVTEVAMRSMAVWSSWLILACNLVQVAWWPLATAIGYTGVLLANVSSARFAVRHLERARASGLSTVPPAHQKIPGLESYRQWGASMFFYAVSVWAFALALYGGLLKDTYVYAFVVVLVNIGLFYIIKTGTNGLEVRAGLNRCFLAAERLRFEAEAGSGLTAPRDKPQRVLISETTPT